MLLIYWWLFKIYIISFHVLIFNYKSLLLSNIRFFYFNFHQTLFFLQFILLSLIFLLFHFFLPKSISVKYFIIWILFFYSIKLQDITGKIFWFNQSRIKPFYSFWITRLLAPIIFLLFCTHLILLKACKSYWVIRCWLLTIYSINKAHRITVFYIIIIIKGYSICF